MMRGGGARVSKIASAIEWSNVKPILRIEETPFSVVIIIQ